MFKIGIVSPKYADKTPDSVITDRTSWLRASMSGIFTRQVKLGEFVKKGEILGVLSDPFEEEREKVLAPFAGIVIGQLSIPLVHEGDALVHLARVTDHDEAEEAMDHFASTLTDEDFGMER